MKNRPSIAILDRTFRSNPDLRIVAFEHLTAREKAALGALREDTGYFGIMLSTKGSGPSIKAVCKNTALLFDSLQMAGPLPRSLMAESSKEANRQIAEFVMDDMLQVYHDGRFVSGAEAQALIHTTEDRLDNPGRLARLSLDALKYGERLPIDDQMRLSAQLYFFSRIPLTPRWMRNIGTDATFSRFLGLEKGGRSACLLDASWNEVPFSPERAGWRAWALRKDCAGRRGAYGGYKLYVSPDPAAVGDIFPDLVEVLTDIGVPRFKIGADLAGLMRPDKIVAYFDSFDRLDEAAQCLAERFSAVAAHGVPFTAELGGDGLLSWGMDPYDKPVFQWQTSASWRLWITNHLAGALLAARRSPDQAVAPWRFAMERLRLLGVDTNSWAPTPVYEQKTNH